MVCARTRRLPESLYVNHICPHGFLYWRAAAVLFYRGDRVSNYSDRREPSVLPRLFRWSEPVWLIDRERTCNRKIDPPPPGELLPSQDHSEVLRGWTLLR